MKLVVFALLTLTLFSCSSIGLKGRRDKDVSITSENSGLLLGSYFMVDTFHNANDTISIIIDSINRNSIFYSFSDSSKQIKKGTFKGHFKKGYFRVKKEYNFTFLFGPLLYLIQDDYRYIGLSKNGELVQVKTYPGGVLLLIAIPVGAAGGGQYEEIFKRRTD